MRMSDDDAPDWPPVSSAPEVNDGERRYGSTGQLWQARNGQWVRLKKPAAVSPETQKQ